MLCRSLVELLFVVDVVYEPYVTAIANDAAHRIKAVIP